MSRLLRLGIALALFGLWALAPATRGANAQSLNAPGGSCTSGNGATVCSQTIPLDNGPYFNGISCGTFDILEHDIGTLYIRQYYDQSGTPTKIMVDLQQPIAAGSTISNSVTGASLPLGAHQLLRFSDFDPSSGTFQTVTISGQDAISTLPTVGLVSNQSGHFSFGPDGVLQASHLLTEQAIQMEIQAVCSALS